jgi:hypothetical protein
MHGKTGRPSLKKLVKIREHTLQVQVINFLDIAARHDVYYFAVPNAARRSRFTASRMKAEGMRSGVADLGIMLPEGRTAWLEMKTLTGKQSPTQKGFEAICRRLGHTYGVAHSFNEAVMFLRNIGALK